MAAEKELRFFQLFKKGDSKLVWIITLIALLELIKQHVIRAFQEKPFGDIILTMVNGKG
jgi:chromatin segregation and condensation protein Rec8/ScpA/Scc1 (kleisin family)